MPYATVNSGPHEITLRYELLVGEHAWDEMVAREACSGLQQPDGAAPAAQGERVPLSQRWDLVERGGLPDEGLPAPAASEPPQCQERVIFIPGLAAKATTEYFQQQIKHITALKDSMGHPLACVCVFDNRGVGRSSVPEQRQHYTTDIMCRDVIGLLDHLGWQERVHAVGQSLGALVTLKLAAAAPERLKSVTITGGVLAGTQMLWSGCRSAPRMAAQFFFGGLESKIRSNLRMQYTAGFLAQSTAEAGASRLDAMAAATLAEIQRKRATVPQEVRRRNMMGRRGQLRATIWHRLSKKEVRAIADAGHFKVLILHGWQDRFISPGQAHQLGATLRADMLVTEAAHAGIGIEAAAVVNRALEAQLMSKTASGPTLCAPGGPLKARLLSGGHAAQQPFHLQAISAHGSKRFLAPSGKLVKRMQTVA